MNSIGASIAKKTPNASPPPISGETQSAYAQQLAYFRHMSEIEY